MQPAAFLPVRPRLIQFLVSCVVLGIGVGLLLRASLGSDGYSTLVNGAAMSVGVPFFVMNAGVAAVFVAIAWLRGLPPGWSTIVQPVLVGFVINGVLVLVDGPDSLVLRTVLLVVAFPVVIAGVSGYLGSGAGAGPTEAAALAFDPPVPFRWSYSVLQGGSALIGWLLGAAIGPGTLLVIFLLGPAVDRVSARVRFLDIHASGLGRSSAPLPPVACER
ncbi:MAG: uncharacterized protein QOG80_1730 [Pseudonocardiales bacterium]|nr:uncharacterized protein [Pseudonocardiales bacterium]